MTESGLTSHDVTAELAYLGAQAAGQAGAENFPVALRVLPRVPRDLLQRVYVYARFVDDVGDRAMGDRTELLDAVAEDVARLFATDGPAPSLTAVAGLRPLVDRCTLGAQPLLDLIEANRLDQRVSGYPTFTDLLDYCQLSAAPIGLMVLHVAGAVTPDNVRDSDQVCAALQILEHCQDVGEDARAGRIYLPAEDLAGVGVDPTAFAAPFTAPELRGVLATEVGRARALLDPGRDLVHRLSGWSKVAVAGYVAGGLATVDALRGADYEVLAHEVRPSKAATATHALRLLAAR